MDFEFARYDDLVGRIYDAGLDPTRWPAALANLTETCGGTRSLLFTAMHAPAQGGFVFPYNIPQASIERWAAKNIVEDPFIHVLRARNLIQPGAAFNGADLVAHDEFMQTVFYRELWAPIDIARVCFGIVFGGTDAHVLPTFISVFRPERAAPFEASHAALIRRLLAHMSRALGVMYHLRDSQFRVASRFAALDRLRAGVVLLDARGAVQFVNVVAQRQLANASIIRLRDGEASPNKRLALAERLNQFDAAFRQAIRTALSPLTAPVNGHFSNALVLPDEQGRPACVLHVATLGQAPGLATGNRAPHAIVFLYDLAAASSVPPELLSELFDLTPAEARAALQVLQGGGADTIAQRLGVSISTFRTQLRIAFAKCGTHRQADLLKLLLALAP